MALLDAFLDGVTGAGLFAKLNWPGAPTELIDSRTPDEFHAAESARTTYHDQILWQSERIPPRDTVRRSASAELHRSREK